MIHEEICTYEVAKLAKEKGFGEMASCYQGYRKDGTLFYFSNMPNGKERVMQMDCLAPTQSLLQRWLREEKALNIQMALWEEGWYYEIWAFEYYEEEKQYSIKILHQSSNYSTYELALEDALKYALENLIED